MASEKWKENWNKKKKNKWKNRKGNRRNALRNSICLLALFIFSSICLSFFSWDFNFYSALFSSCSCSRVCVLLWFDVSVDHSCACFLLPKYCSCLSMCAMSLSLVDSECRILLLRSLFIWAMEITFSHWILYKFFVIVFLLLSFPFTFHKWTTCHIFNELIASHPARSSFYSCFLLFLHSCHFHMFPVRLILIHLFVSVAKKKTK